MKFKAQAIILLIFLGAFATPVMALAETWLMVDYTQYEFLVEYSVPFGEIGYLFGFRFSDGYGQVTYWYDYQNQTWSAEGDGWQRLPYTPGPVTNDGLDYNVTWFIRVTQKAFDAYNVDTYYAYETLEGTWTGWAQLEADAFHIYVVGGLNFETHSGWAGQQGDGYSPWEIYAADSRTPVLLDLEDFDVGTQSPYLSEETEGAQVGYLAERGWLLYLSRWDDTSGSRIKGYPTHNFWNVAAVPSGKLPYVSYPYGFRLIDEQTTELRPFYIEKEFRRSVTAADDELVYVEFMMMTPDNTHGGEIRVQDISLYKEGYTHMAAQLRFDAAGDLDIYNSTGSSWYKLKDVVNYKWYKIKLKFNVVAQTVNVYVDDVFLLSNFPFADAACTSLGVFFIGRANAIVSTNDFYVDDVFAWTDWQHEYGGEVRTSAIYKDMQSFSTVIGLGMGEPNIDDFGLTGELPDEGYWNIGFDTLFNDETSWITNMLNVNITLVDIVSKSNTRYVELNVTWMSHGDIIKADTIYAFWGGYGEIGIDVDITKLWIDIWYNRVNASTIIEGRITAFEYGMKDTQNPIAQHLFGRNWEEVSEATTSFCVTSILDDGDNIRSAREIALTRLFMEVHRSENYEFHYRFRITDPMSIGQTGGLMIGIDGIPPRDTRIPKLPSGGIVNFILAPIMGLGRYLITAGTNLALSAIDQVGFRMDNVLEYFFHQPNMFSNVLTICYLTMSNTAVWLGNIITMLVFYLRYVLNISWTVMTINTYITRLVSHVAGPITYYWPFLVDYWGLLLAWWNGTSYVTTWGLTYDYTNLAGLTYGGYQGGQVIFLIIFWGYIVTLPIRAAMLSGSSDEPMGKFFQVLFEPFTIASWFGGKMLWIIVGVMRMIGFVVGLFRGGGSG